MLGVIGEPSTGVSRAARASDIHSGRRQRRAGGCRLECVGEANDIFYFYFYFLVWRLACVLLCSFWIGSRLPVCCRCVASRKRRAGEESDARGAVISLVERGCDRDPRPNHSGQPIMGVVVLLMSLLHPCTHIFVHVRMRLIPMSKYKCASTYVCMALFSPGP